MCQARVKKYGYILERARQLIYGEYSITVLWKYARFFVEIHRKREFLGMFPMKPPDQTAMNLFRLEAKVAEDDQGIIFDLCEMKDSKGVQLYNP